MPGPNLRDAIGSSPVNEATPAESCLHPESVQETLFAARDYISGDEFRLQRCGVCSLLRTIPAPTRDEMMRYYPPAYYGEARRYLFPIDWVLQRLQAGRSRHIRCADADRVGRVLEVGCGQGVLLAHLRSRGWQVIGTELSDEAARFARETLQLDVRVGELTALQLDGGSFESVVLWHVLEHVDDPASLVREVSRLVRPGGTILVSVPNVGSIEARLWKAGWFHLDVPRHLSHFTRHALTRMLEMNGFTIEHVGYFSPEYDFFSFIQSTLNGLGLPQNLLYELLRAGPAKVLRLDSARARRGPAVLSLALAPFLALLSLVVVPLLAALQQGATITLVARKR